jgi:hypothetical protein
MGSPTHRLRTRNASIELACNYLEKARGQKMPGEDAAAGAAA